MAYKKPVSSENIHTRLRSFFRNNGVPHGNSLRFRWFLRTLQGILKRASPGYRLYTKHENMLERGNTR